MRAILVMAIAGILAACGGGSGGGGATVPSYSAGSGTWRVFTTERNDIAFTDLPGSGVAYDLPTQATSPAGYVVRRAPEGAKSRLRLRLTVEGDGTARPVNGDLNCTGQQATVGLYFQRAGDDWLAKNGTEHYRWFSNVRVPIAPATVDLDLSLDAADDEWVNVTGNPRGAAANSDAFRAAVRDMRWVGVTHGGCGAAGHGAYAVEGAIRVTVESLVVE